MPDTSSYAPPKIWKWDTENGGAWAKLNRPTAGAQFEKVLPRGKHPLQLYSLATPNGVKVTVLLEELLALGHGGARHLGVDHVIVSCCGRDHDVRFDHGLRALLERHGLRAERGGDVGGALGGAAGDDRLRDARADQIARGQLSGFSGADDEHRLLGEVARTLAR